MIKKLLCSAVLLAGGILTGADAIDWQDWQLVYDKNITPEKAALLKFSENITAQNIKIPASGVNLDQVMQQPAKSGKKAVLFKKVVSEKDQVVNLGIGVDWWFEVYCNNKVVYSTYRSSGNGDSVITSKNQIVPLELRKGKNIIAIYLVI